MARRAGVEPATFWFVVKYSVQLSYRRRPTRFSFKNPPFIYTILSASFQWHLRRRKCGQKRKESWPGFLIFNMGKEMSNHIDTYIIYGKCEWIMRVLWKIGENSVRVRTVIPVLCPLSKKILRKSWFMCIIIWLCPHSKTDITNPS